MAIFKCKMCGGDLVLNEDLKVAVCEYCGTKQTVPKLDSEKRVNLYDRANHFRRNNDFDKAMSIYEQILNESPQDSEAYWSLVLCKYGIEYVEEGKKHIPTVNRAQYTSVFADEDYKSAIQYADSVQKSVYESEAKTIDEIQRGILEISQKEAPFDVFICYKETDQNGRRTPDSVLATELYHQLTQEGYKVFFSRITLEDKLGSAYEPYIFAALNSAKVMVVMGTKPEYFNAVWVKNEWSRFLGLIKKGENKILVPAYRDMDPYDLPEEFSHLQAQDMSKLGFMQDLIRGITKLAEKPSAQPRTQFEPSVGNTTAPLLKRAFMFLEDGDFGRADEYCEQVLNLDPECGEAYLGKLLVSLSLRKREDLAECADLFDENNYYKKVVRFGDANLVAELNGCLETIKQRNIENAKEAQYLAAKDAVGNKDFSAAISIFNSIKAYKDSEALINKCESAQLEHFSNIYNLALQNIEEKDFVQALNKLETIPDFENAQELIEKCKYELEQNNYESLYNEGLAAYEEVLSGDYAELDVAINCFKQICGYKDSAELLKACEGFIAKRKLSETKGFIILAGLCMLFTAVVAMLVINGFLG